VLIIVTSEQICDYDRRLFFFKITLLCTPLVLNLNNLALYQKVFTPLLVEKCNTNFTSKFLQYTMLVLFIYLLMSQNDSICMVGHMRQILLLDTTSMSQISLFKFTPFSHVFTMLEVTSTLSTQTKYSDICT
jgi:hypothetical protein